MYKKILIVIFMIVFIGGCASKEKLYNRPAMFWYSKIIQEIKKYDLEQADDYFSSLASEHINSPILKDAMIIMALAHMDEEEYILANFYLDEYIKRFGDKKGSEYARFLKIKASFYGLQNPKRDQKLILDTLAKAKEYKIKYPDSIYNYMVDSIVAKLEVGRYLLLKDIAKLHKKLGNEEAYDIYKEKLDASWVNELKIIEAKRSFLRYIFE